MKKEIYLEEKKLVNMPKSIPYQVSKILNKIMETQICKIACKDVGHERGFFCNILYGWNSTLKVLMTNNHIFNKDDILPNKIIKFSINNNLKNYKIEIYTNKEYEVTIIEIKEKDKIEKIHFLI